MERKSIRWLESQQVSWCPQCTTPVRFHRAGLRCSFSDCNKTPAATLWQEFFVRFGDDLWQSACMRASGGQKTFSKRFSGLSKTCYTRPIHSLLIAGERDGNSLSFIMRYFRVYTAKGTAPRNINLCRGWHVDQDVELFALIKVLGESREAFFQKGSLVAEGFLKNCLNRRHAS